MLSDGPVPNLPNAPIKATISAPQMIEIDVNRLKRAPLAGFDIEELAFDSNDAGNRIISGC